MKILLFLAVLLLAGCDQLKERAGIPDPVRVEAEGKAIGGACRHAGRGLEDCYRLNPEASKPAIYAGWKEMNEYMAKNNITAVEPTIPPLALMPPEPPAKKQTKKTNTKAHDGEAETEKKSASEKDAAH